MSGAHVAANVCGDGQAYCLCERDEGHDGSHRCDCGGSWSYDADGKFRVEAWPRGFSNPFGFLFSEPEVW